MFGQLMKAKLQQVNKAEIHTLVVKDSTEGDDVATMYNTFI